MLFIFPRLDRPTVVGEEGRPRGVSLSIAGVVIFLLSILGGGFLGNGRLVMSIGLLTGSLVVGLALLDRDRLGLLIVGTIMAVPLSTVVVLWIARQSLSASRGLVSLGITIALLGMGLTWIDLDGKDDVEEVVNRVAIGYGGTIIGGFVPMMLYGGFVFAVDAVAPGNGGFASVFGFPISVVFLCGSLYIASGALPIVQLSPRPERPAVAERVARVRRGAVVAGGITLAATIALIVLPVGLEGVLAVLATPLIVWPLLLASGGLVVLSSIAALAQRLTRDRDVTAQRRVAAIVAGAFVGILLLALPLPPTALAIGIVAFLVGPILFIVGVVLFGVVLGSGFAPEEFGGLTLASAGLAMLTVGAGLSGMPAPFVFAAGAGTIVVWDVSMYGAGVTAELGHLPETRRLELVHAVVVVFVGAVAIAAATGLFALKTVVGVGLTVTAAMAVAVIGAVVALLPLRG